VKAPLILVLPLAVRWAVLLDLKIEKTHLSFYSENNNNEYEGYRRNAEDQGEA
jgi:hypothetical protein